MYYDPDFGDPGYFTGAAFDGWDRNGSRTEDADRFTADDLVAVTFLSVRVKATGAYWPLAPELSNTTPCCRQSGMIATSPTSTGKTSRQIRRHGPWRQN